jgi:hypothetical protein
MDVLPSLAFNHNDIVAQGIRRVRGKPSYSSLPALLMPSASPSSDPASDAKTPRQGVRCAAGPAGVHRCGAEAQELVTFQKTAF